MTDLQSLILYIAVQKAKKQAMVVPSAAELVKALPKERRMGVRGASEHLRRLTKTHGCFEKQGKRWIVNREALVTEPESAQYLMSLYERCSADLQGRTTREDLLAEFQRKWRIALSDAEQIAHKAIAGGYV